MAREIVKANLSTQITARIIELIESGEWEEGKRIPKEMDLAAMFSVSRSMTREALQVLVSNGILESKSGAGTFVSDGAIKNIHNMQFFERMRSNIDFCELYDARMLIEPSLAYYAAIRRTDEDLAVIGRVMKDDIASMQGPKNDSSDFPFHQWVARTAHNQLLENMLVSILEKLGSTEYSDLFEHVDKDVDRSSQGDHMTIVQAIISSNAALARELMSKHLSDRLNVINTPYKYSFRTGKSKIK